MAQRKCNGLKVDSNFVFCIMSSCSFSFNMFYFLNSFKLQNKSLEYFFQVWFSLYIPSSWEKIKCDFFFFCIPDLQKLECSYMMGAVGQILGISNPHLSNDDSSWVTSLEALVQKRSSIESGFWMLPFCWLFQYIIKISLLRNCWEGWMDGSLGIRR